MRAPYIPEGAAKTDQKLKSVFFRHAKRPALAIVNQGLFFITHAVTRISRCYLRSHCIGVLLRKRNGVLISAVKVSGLRHRCNDGKGVFHRCLLLQLG